MCCWFWSPRRPPADYLAYLRAEPICYLVASEERVDLRTAVGGWGTELGIDCVVSTAGGGAQRNDALLRAGLV